MGPMCPGTHFGTVRAWVRIRGSDRNGREAWHVWVCACMDGYANECTYVIVPVDCAWNGACVRERVRLLMACGVRMSVCENERARMSVRG